MKIKKLNLSGLSIIQPNIFHDKRGFLCETYNESLYLKLIKSKIVQVIHSHSKKNTIRGIHFQYPNLQGKLVSVLQGKIFDVSVDIRKSSSTFGKWCGVFLDSKNKQQLWIPEGFGHGYLVMSKTADIIYKCTQKYYPNNQKGIVWDDPFIKINWPTKKPILSKKDLSALTLEENKKLPK